MRKSGIPPIVTLKKGIQYSIHIQNFAIQPGLLDKRVFYISLRIHACQPVGDVTWIRLNILAEGQAWCAW
jgi:hypothetical protein